MPKKPNKSYSWGGRGGGGRPSGNLNDRFSGHDDRINRSERSPSFAHLKPRVTFKKVTNRANFDLAIRECIDNDITMTVGGGGGGGGGGNNNGRQVNFRGRGRGYYYDRQNPRMQGRNSPLPHRSSNKFQMRSQFPLLESSWYKITIPFGFKYTKEFILNTLMGHLAPDTFVPIMYKITPKDASFYVDNSSIALKLHKCDNQLATNDGFKLKVRVRPGLPVCEFDDTFKERLKHALNKRYKQETNALDLSRLHLDADLADDYFCALFKPQIMTTVLDLIGEHIPNLEALNLDGNKLQVIDRLSVLKNKFEKLKILYIGDNRVKEITQLDALKNLNLEELRLEGNPLCNKYKSRFTEYVSDVRKRFPKLLRLDGTGLPKPIVFDVSDEEDKMPASKRIFVANSEAQKIVNQFLQQYFIIYDSDNRQPLLDAYHEQSTFSMTVAPTINPNKTSEYLNENRNLYRQNDPNKRRKLLKTGRLQIVSFISGMPKVKHDLSSFTMDLNFVNDGMMLMTVTGLFKELETKDSALRFFNRTFLIVPEGSGYCILNELLHIGNPTELQEKRAFSTGTAPAPAPAPVSTPAPVPVLAPAPVPVSAAVPTPSPVPAEVDVPSPGPSQNSIPSEIQSSSPTKMDGVTSSEDLKHTMTMELSRQTNMNFPWSLKCLEEVNWNFTNALAAFKEFFERGQIPPEAFRK